MKEGKQEGGFLKKGIEKVRKLKNKPTNKQIGKAQYAQIDDESCRNDDSKSYSTNTPSGDIILEDEETANLHKRSRNSKNQNYVH